MRQKDLDAITERFDLIIELLEEAVEALEKIVLEKEDE